MRFITFRLLIFPFRDTVADRKCHRIADGIQVLLDGFCEDFQLFVSSGLYTVDPVCQHFYGLRGQDDAKGRDPIDDVLHGLVGFEIGFDGVLLLGTPSQIRDSLVEKQLDEVLSSELGFHSRLVFVGTDSLHMMFDILICCGNPLLQDHPDVVFFIISAAHKWHETHGAEVLSVMDIAPFPYEKEVLEEVPADGDDHPSRVFKL